jgi:hypothetical protein
LLLQQQQHNVSHNASASWCKLMPNTRKQRAGARTHAQTHTCTHTRLLCCTCICNAASLTDTALWGAQQLTLPVPFVLPWCSWLRWQSLVVMSSISRSGVVAPPVAAGAAVIPVICPLCLFTCCLLGAATSRATATTAAATAQQASPALPEEQPCQPSCTKVQVHRQQRITSGRTRQASFFARATCECVRRQLCQASKIEPQCIATPAACLYRMQW